MFILTDRWEDPDGYPEIQMYKADTAEKAQEKMRALALRLTAGDPDAAANMKRFEFGKDNEIRVYDEWGISDDRAFCHDSTDMEHYCRHLFEIENLDEIENC